MEDVGRASGDADPVVDEAAAKKVDRLKTVGIRIRIWQFVSSGQILVLC